MATAAIAAKNATVEVSSDGGATYNKIGEMREVNLSVEVGDIDATSLDSAGWEERLDGIKSWSGTAAGFYLEANAGQDAVWAALEGSTALKLRFRPKGALAGAKQFVGDIRIRGYNLAAAVSDALAKDISFSGTGAIVRSAQ